MLHPAHKVLPPLRISNATATTSRVQPVLQTTNNDNIDWQHNNMYHGQSTSQDLKQPPPSPPPPPPLLSNTEPPLSFMAGRDYPQTSALDSHNRLFGDNMYRDRRPNNFLTMPTPMIVQQPIVPEQKVPPRIIKTSQSQAQQAPNQTVNTSDSEKAALIMQVLQLTDVQIAKLPLELRQRILKYKEKIFNSKKKD
ncbi:hypothetical protein QTP88_007576 [Uroleucon formosanum]